jgi:hypothetical protein
MDTEEDLPQLGKVQMHVGMEEVRAHATDHLLWWSSSRACVWTLLQIRTLQTYVRFQFSSCICVCLHRESPPVSLDW